MEPSNISKNRGIRSAIVDLPDPLAPTKATVFPFGISKLILDNLNEPSP